MSNDTSEICNLNLESLEGKILFRSITPLQRYDIVDNSTPLPFISGDRHGSAYRVYLASSTGWEQAQSSLLKYWSADQLLSFPEFTKNFTTVDVCKLFLVVDHIVDDSSEARIMHIPRGGDELLLAAINALILLYGAQGPYIESTWKLQFPLRNIVRSSPLVSMNLFHCRSDSFTSSGEFSTAFKALLDKSWGDSQFGRVLNLALNTLSGSLRTVEQAHSFALLAMTFETLFSKTEDDFSGGSRRLARLAGNTKGEVTLLHRFLDESTDENSVRKLRNHIIHGNERISDHRLEPVRLKFAGLLAQATIFLVQYFATTVPTGNYYDEMERVANDRFNSLPSQ